MCGYVLYLRVNVKWFAFNILSYPSYVRWFECLLDNEMFGQILWTSLSVLLFPALHASRSFCSRSLVNLYPLYKSPPPTYPFSFYCFFLIKASSVSCSNFFHKSSSCLEEVEYKTTYFKVLIERRILGFPWFFHL